MPPQQSSSIKWHEVTWYSKLGALILFVGVVPALSFYIGMQYEMTRQAVYEEPSPVIPEPHSLPLAPEEPQPSTSSTSSIWSVEPTRGSAPLTIKVQAMVGGFLPYDYAVSFGDGSAEAPIHCSAPNDQCIAPGEVAHTYKTAGTYTVALKRYGYRDNPASGVAEKYLESELGRQQIVVQ